METVYRIRRWDEIFAVNRSRELKNPTWVPWPIRTDGAGYCELVDHPDGAARYGVWAAIVSAAARCDPPGTLLRRNGSPLTSTDIARISRLRKKSIDDAWPVFARLGWLEPCTISQDGATIPQDGALDEMREDERREDEKRSSSREPPKSWKASDVEAIYEAYPRKVGKAAALKAIDKALIGIHAEGFDSNGTKAHEWLLSVVQRYAASKAGRPPPRDERDFRPHPATWFNAGRYDDDEKEWKK